MQKMKQLELWEIETPQIKWNEIPNQNQQQAIDLILKIMIDHLIKLDKGNKENA